MASPVTVSCPPRVCEEALRALILIRRWFQLSLTCNVSDHLHKPGHRCCCSRYNCQTSWRLSAVDTKTWLLLIQLSSLPIYLCLVTLTMNVWTNHECLGGVLDAGGDMDLGIYVNSNRRIIAPYLLFQFNHNIEKT